MSHNEPLNSLLIDHFNIQHGHHFPAEGVAKKLVDFKDANGSGPVWVWITPCPEGGNARHRHRVRCTCPECGAEMSAGRLHQHIHTATCYRQKQERRHGKTRMAGTDLEGKNVVINIQPGGSVRRVS